ncbi:MAG: DUF6580 family putative transport protein [Woeseiaceae bacterium]|nr:DUF6580 family putative transport protein [Woeseiaceae bacterium]
MNRLLLTSVSLLHFLPRPFGATPIGAIALYSGAYGNARIAWLTPLVPLFIGDLIGGFYNVTVMVFVYLGFALSAVVGRLLLSRERSARRIAVAIMAAAVIFYLVSNFSIWLVGMYPATLAGLIACYVNGLPYLGIALVADSAYCLLLFGAHALIERERPAAATT